MANYRTDRSPRSAALAAVGARYAILFERRELVQATGRERRQCEWSGESEIGPRIESAWELGGGSEDELRRRFDLDTPRAEQGTIRAAASGRHPHARARSRCRREKFGVTRLRSVVM